MRGRFHLSIVGLIACTSLLRAEPPRFQSHKGETLSYHAVQTTKIVQSIPDEKTGKPIVDDATTRIDLVRKWKVIDVDGKGVATLEMSIASMRFERKSGKDVDVFDSTKPDDLNKREMAKHVGPVLAVLRMDPVGRLVEVKESKVGPATRFAADLPFKLTLPETTPKTGDAWHRTYTIQIDPPLGTGEKYQATQNYTCLQPKSGLIAIGLSTEVKDMPTQAADQIPLLPMCAKGLCISRPKQAAITPPG